MQAQLQMAPKPKKKHGFIREMRQNGFLYLLTLPGIVFFLIFSYVPMLGMVMAFQNYSMRKGIFGSPFNGLDNFKFLFQTPSRSRRLPTTCSASSTAKIWPTSTASPSIPSTALRRTSRP